MDSILGEKLKKALEEHTDIVEKLQKFSRIKSNSDSEKEEFQTEAFYNELENVRARFEKLSKHYRFSAVQMIIIHTVFDLITALVESFKES